MLRDRIEAKWIDAFVRVFELCKVRAGEACAVLSETQSRALNVHLAELALARLGATMFHVVVPSPQQHAPVPVRSTGGATALADQRAAIAGLKAAVKRARAAKTMRVVSAAGTELTVDMREASTAGVWGWCDRPRTVAHWPGGLVVSFPRTGAVNGMVVLDAGDVNLTFKRYLESPVRLAIEADYVTRIEGTGTDAELMRRYFAAWGDREAYATSHVGWGLNGTHHV